MISHGGYKDPWKLNYNNEDRRRTLRQEGVYPNCFWAIVKWFLWTLLIGMKGESTVLVFWDNEALTCITPTIGANIYSTLHYCIIIY